MKSKLKILLTSLLTFIGIGAITALVGCDTSSPSNPPDMGHTHSYTESITPPTCTEAGYTLHTCTCGESYKDSYVNAKGHTPNTAVKENEHDSTCKMSGSYDEVVYCSVCNDEISRMQKAIEKNQHTPEAAVVENQVEATCKMSGSYYEVVYCSVCNDELSRTAKTIDKKQHTPKAAVVENKVEATCKTVGSYSEVVYCSGCNDELSRTPKTIDKKQHTPKTPVVENEVDSTCETAGSYSEVVYCSVCDDELSRTQKVIPAKGHSYTDGICTLCGDDQTKRLQFTENGDGTYSVSKGSATDENIFIPKTYMGKPVTAIAELAFYNSAIKSVTIPDSITAIGNRAFAHCNSLTSVTIPGSVATSGFYTFADCTNLTSVTIQDGVKTIGLAAFENCTKLTSITIPDSVTTIKDYALKNCTGLTSITLPAGVTTIGNSAFNLCEGLTKLNYKGSLEQWLGINFASKAANPMYYAGNIYIDGENLTELVIPDGTTTIGDFAFYGCLSLTSITIPAGVTTFGNNAFANCESLTKLNYKGSLEQWLNIDFASKAANPMSQTGNIYIDGKILTELVIPDGITEIKNYSFGKCLSLTSIKIPASVNYIGEYAFRGSCFVESITVDSGNTTYKCVDNCLIDIATRNLVFGCSNSKIPDDGSVTSIGRAFVDCTFTSITVPDTVTVIGDDAFRGSKLTSVVIPATVKEISGYAFSGCFDLKNVTFEDTEGWIWITPTGEIPATEAQLADVTTFTTSDFRTYRLIHG